MRADKQNNYSKPYSIKHKREEECKYKITCQCVIKEEIEVFGVKPLRFPPSGN